MITTGWFSFKYSQFVWTACLKVESCSLTKAGWQVFLRQDGYSIGQDGKCNQQAIEIHDRMVSRWAESKSGYRVMGSR